MDERAFDRYGRIIGATGYDYVAAKVAEGLTPFEIAEAIHENHPSLDRTQIEDYVKDGIQADSQGRAFQDFIQSKISDSDSIDFDRSEVEREYRESVILNPRLFGIRPEGDRFKYTFEFGETEGLALIKVSITSPEWLEYFDAYRKAYELAIEICRQYPAKFGLENPDDCDFIFSKAYAPEKRW